MKKAGELAHTRKIDMAIFEADEDHIVVEGRLIDDREKDYFLISGEQRAAGELHNIVVRMLLKVPEMMIEDIEAEMDSVPRDECHQTMESINSVKGLLIERGFVNSVYSLIGGTKGCSHIAHLITSMGPASLQGYWALKAQKPVSGENIESEIERIDQMRFKLLNTCYVWRKDGPAFNRLQDVSRRLGEEIDD